VTDRDIVNAGVKQMEKKRAGKNESEERESSECVSHSMALHCVDTTTDYMGKRRVEYSDIKAARKIRTAVRRSLSSSQKQATITNYFSK
jgi:hypothetical protein